MWLWGGLIVHFVWEVRGSMSLGVSRGGLLHVQVRKFPSLGRAFACEHTWCAIIWARVRVKIRCFVCGGLLAGAARMRKYI